MSQAAEPLACPQGAAAQGEAMGGRERLRSALLDLLHGLALWRVWTMLAFADIRGRYRRSKFGQLWLTLSMVVTIGALGVVYSTLFRQDLASYLPFVAAGLVAWALLAAIITEGAQTFVEAEGYIRNVAMPKSLFVYRMLARNLIVFAHNLVLVPVAVLAFDADLSPAVLLVLPSVALVLLNGVWIGILLGTLCARFRDLPQIVASVVQVAFFMSPVIWKPEQLAGRMPILTDWNPFSCFLALLREPLIGRVPSGREYLLALLVTVLGLAVALPFFSRFRARIVYYL